MVLLYGEELPIDEIGFFARCVDLRHERVDLMEQVTGEAVKPEESAGLTGKERRRHRCFNCDAFAETAVIHSECLFRGKVRDISESGCYIVTRARLALERLDGVELRFKVNNNRYRTYARVMDLRPGKGIGVEFIFTDPESRESIKALIDTLGTASLPKAAEGSVAA
jgi:hypothetical protein